MMGTLKWYKRDPQAAIDGMMTLTLEERGAYNTVLDLFYVRDGNLPDDDRFIAGFLGVDIRVWRRIRSRLIELGKLSIEDGKLSNHRAATEVHDALARVVSAQYAGKQSAKTRGAKSKPKKPKNKDLDGTGVEGSVERPFQPYRNTLTEREEPLHQEERSDSTDRSHEKETSHYAWAGKIIRLKQRDFDQWKSSYHGIADIEGELRALDAWIASEDQATRKRWFVVISGVLNKKHQAALRKNTTSADEEDLPVC